MPIYEYQCEKCGRRFEYMQSFSERPKTKCEECGGKLDKLISAAAFHLKGTGWYKTDYASGSSNGGGKAKKGESKSETAPASDKGKGKE